MEAEEAGRTIRCTRCGKEPLPLPADEGWVALMCMCMAMEWDQPPLNPATHELPEIWEWV